MRIQTSPCCHRASPCARTMSPWSVGSAAERHPRTSPSLVVGNFAGRRPDRCSVDFVGAIDGFPSPHRPRRIKGHCEAPSRRWPTSPTPVPARSHRQARSSLGPGPNPSHRTVALEPSVHRSKAGPCPHGSRVDRDHAGSSSLNVVRGWSRILAARPLVGVAEPAAVVTVTPTCKVRPGRC